MEKKNSLKISLSTFLLFIEIFIIIIMGIHIYTLYNEKIETNKNSAELQFKVNSLNETIDDLQEKINNLSKASNLNSSSENTNINFTEKEIIDVLQMCLDLEASKANGLGNILYTLGLYKNHSDSNMEKSAEKTGFIQTSIKFTDFKESIIKYMTEECYQKEWDEFFEDENGYLCYANIGATGISYKVNTINKIEDSYIATVTLSSEESDTEITVKFNLDNNKCIVKSYEF